MGSLLAGFLGALTGLGGGVVIVPMLALVFHVDFKYAIGAALVSVIATSSGAAAAYVKEGYSNIRVGIFLEIATTIGALWPGPRWRCICMRFRDCRDFWCGADSIPHIHHSPWSPCDAGPATGPDRDLAADGWHIPRRAWVGELSCAGRAAGFRNDVCGGVLSGLLGIGSGAVKVLAMDKAMKLPFKVSTTTSNFMIGVTAAASAGIYLSRGYIDPGIGDASDAGSLAGIAGRSAGLGGANVKVLRYVFSGVIGVLAIEMIYSGIDWEVVMKSDSNEAMK